MLFKYKTKPEYHFKHFEFEVNVIETYPDYFNTKNGILRDIQYIKTYFSLLTCQNSTWFLFVLIFWEQFLYDSRNLDDTFGTFLKGAHIW